jgi:hypothetical protein
MIRRLLKPTFRITPDHIIDGTQITSASRHYWTRKSTTTTKTKIQNSLRRSKQWKSYWPFKSSFKFESRTTFKSLAKKIAKCQKKKIIKSFLLLKKL